MGIQSSVSQFKSLVNQSVVFQPPMSPLSLDIEDPPHTPLFSCTEIMVILIMRSRHVESKTFNVVTINETDF